MDNDLKNETFWLDLLSKTFTFAIPICLIVIYYLLLNKVNRVLVKKYLLHIILTCVTIILYESFEHYILIQKYKIQIPDYILSAIWSLMFLAYPTLLVLFIRAVILFFRKENEKK